MWHLWGGAGDAFGSLFLLSGSGVSVAARTSFQRCCGLGRWRWLVQGTRGLGRAGAAGAGEMLSPALHRLVVHGVPYIPGRL